MGNPVAGIAMNGEHDLARVEGAFIVFYVCMWDAHMVERADESADRAADTRTGDHAKEWPGNKHGPYPGYRQSGEAGEHSERASERNSRSDNGRAVPGMPSIAFGGCVHEHDGDFFRSKPFFEEAIDGNVCLLLVAINAKYIRHNVSSIRPRSRG